MAIFQSEENEKKETETVIGPSVKVEGNFKGKGDILVEGELHGSLKTNKSLKVGASAVIKAEVEASTIFLAGTIRGNVKAGEKIELTESAKLFGNVETKNISIASGATFNGKCLMQSEETVSEPELPKINNQKGRNNKAEKN